MLERHRPDINQSVGQEERGSEGDVCLLQSSFIMQCLVGYVRLRVCVYVSHQRAGRYTLAYTRMADISLSHSFCMTDTFPSDIFLSVSLWVCFESIWMLLCWKWFWIALVKACKYCTNGLISPVLLCWHISSS